VPLPPCTLLALIPPAGQGVMLRHTKRTIKSVRNHLINVEVFAVYRHKDVIGRTYGKPKI
jgi:hypothetical protein